MHVYSCRCTQTVISVRVLALPVTHIISCDNLYWTMQLQQSLQGNNLVLNWMEKVSVSTESMMQRGSAAAVGGVAFFNPCTTNTVYAYEALTQEWSELQPLCQHHSFTLVAVNGLLTAVGGSKQKDTPGRALLSFGEGEWKNIFPPMSTQRSSPAALCVDSSLVVGGGCRQDMPTIEVMNTDTQQWCTASTSLPASDEVALKPAAMIALRDRLYVFGDNSNVYACSCSAFLQSCSNKEETYSQQTNVCIWERLSDLPVSQSTVVVLCDHLINVGGCDDSGEVDTVYCYDSATDSWRKLGNLLSPKSLPLVATLPRDKLVVVHENYDRSFIGSANLIES